MWAVSSKTIHFIILIIVKSVSVKHTRMLRVVYWSILVGGCILFGRNPWHTSHACCGKCVNRGSPTTCISLILKPYLSASENCISVFSSETDLGNCVTICADDVIDWIYCSCSIITCENDCWMLPFPYFCRSQLLSSLMQQSDYCTISKCEFYRKNFFGHK